MNGYNLVSARRLPVMVAAAGILSAALVLSSANQALAVAGPVPLASASSFAVLAYSTVTNTGPSVINGDIGVSPGTAVVGFPPGTQPAGATYAGDPVALQARTDATTAYTNATSQSGPTAVGVELGGTTLVPDLYASGGVLQVTGVLTLDGTADPTGIFVFQSTATVITAANSSVVLVNVNPCNVFWVVPSSATLGSNSSFAGTVIANNSIGLGTGATVTGRLLALNGAVSLDSNIITSTGCAPIAVNPGTGITVEAASTATAAAVAAAAAAAAAAAQAALLAATGTESGMALGIGATVLLAGATLIFTARRRSRAAS
jgi:type VI secretion system secreted protein VgrG